MNSHRTFPSSIRLEEYREDIRKTLPEQKDASAKSAERKMQLDKIVEHAQMDIPDAMVDEAG